MLQSPVGGLMLVEPRSSPRFQGGTVVKSLLLIAVKTAFFRLLTPVFAHWGSFLTEFFGGLNAEL